MLSEFDLIKQYFDHTQINDARIALGIGDDCALINPTAGMQLAISTDMLVSGRHFFPDADAFMLGHKSLAVNLSDLAAMGARPLAFTLALSLPEANPTWLAAFSRGLFSLAKQHDCHLIGGDTTKGPLNICITIFGEVPFGMALRRDAAKVGEDIWISGSLGDARLALGAYRYELHLSESMLTSAAQRLHQPTPRIDLGIALRGIASAALDISDGLSGDLGHILERSQVGAKICLDDLPVGVILRSQDLARRREFSLFGGDDYELCFTAPKEKREAVIAAGLACQTHVTRVGEIVEQPELQLLDALGQNLTFDDTSFDHFRSS
ncbi:MAG: thiamine-phosphate kinase [Undibacterium sp.]|nr:thiamine-phosphate kinase [Undibacterium sp.]